MKGKKFSSTTFQIFLEKIFEKSNKKLYNQVARVKINKIVLTKYRYIINLHIYRLIQQLIFINKLKRSVLQKASAIRLKTEVNKVINHLLLKLNHLIN